MGIFRCGDCGALNRMPLAPVTPACSRCRRPLDTTGRPQAVDAAALVSTIRSSPAPVLVDFADRDLPMPAVDGVARLHAGELVVLRVDPGEERAAAEAFEIRGTPTLVLFSGGSEVSRRCDLRGATDVRAWVEASATI
jgi:thioredoxin 2